MAEIANVTIAGVTDRGGTVAGSSFIEHIPAKNEAELNLHLARIFAASKWEVTAEAQSDGSYTYFYREKADDTRPVTLITSREPPRILRSGAAGMQDIFLIPMPVSKLTKADFDAANRRVLFEDHSVEDNVTPCELPGYFAVGLRGPLGTHKIEGYDYTALQIINSPFFQTGVLVDPRCFKPPEKPEEKADVKISISTGPRVLEHSFVFDMSGSVRPSLYFELFRDDIIEKVHNSAFLTEATYTRSECGDRPSSACRDEAYGSLKRQKAQATIGITFFLGSDPLSADVTFDLCDVTGCGEYGRLKTDKEVRPALDRVVKGIEERVKAITPAGQDFPVALPIKLDSFETRYYQGPYGQSIAGRLFRDVCATTISETACRPAEDRQKIIEWSLAEDLPLFLSVSLTPTGDDISVPNGGLTSFLFNDEPSDYELETALRSVFLASPANRSAEVYEKLKTIAFGIRRALKSVKDFPGWATIARDRNVSAAAAAVLGAWALKGDATARKVLFELLDQPDLMDSEEAMTVVARSLSLLINDEEAQGLLKRIKATPDAGENSMLLAALAGHEEFLDGVAIMLNSYHPQLYETAGSPAVVEAMRRVFADPIIQTGDLDISPEDRGRLAGNNWRNDLLQRVHEEMLFSQQMSTRETAKALEPALILMYEYAVNAIPREIIEKRALTVNTDLTKRHIYTGLTEAEMGRQGVLLARTAKREEAYLSIRPDDDDAITSIEVGLLESEGSVTMPYLLETEQSRFFEAAGVDAEDEFTVVHWHIHPIGSTNSHKMIYNIPSSTDLTSYLKFVYKWKGIVPFAEFEFKIMTPTGILSLKPKDPLIRATEDAETYKEYEDVVDMHQIRINNSGGQITIPSLAENLERFFEVKFETIK